MTIYKSFSKTLYSTIIRMWREGYGVQDICRIMNLNDYGKVFTICYETELETGLN